MCLHFYTCVGVSLLPAGRMKMQVRNNEVEMLAQASTDGATIDGSRCERDITKHPNKHVNLRNNFKVGPMDSGWALTWLTVL